MINSGLITKVANEAPCFAGRLLVVCALTQSDFVRLAVNLKKWLRDAKKIARKV